MALLGVSAQGPDLVHVASHNFLESQLKGPLEDRVPGGSEEQLTASALGNGAHRSEVFGELECIFSSATTLSKG